MYWRLVYLRPMLLCLVQHAPEHSRTQLPLLPTAASVLGIFEPLLINHHMHPKKQQYPFLLGVSLPLVAAVLIVQRHHRLLHTVSSYSPTLQTMLSCFQAHQLLWRSLHKGYLAAHGRDQKTVNGTPWRTEKLQRYRISICATIFLILC